LKGLIQVAAVNCDEHKGLAQNFGIKGFPTIKVFGAELEQDPSNPERMVKLPIDYNGARSAKGIVEFALSQLHSKYITKLTAKSEEEFLDFSSTKMGTIPRVLLFTNKPQTTNLYKVLSMEYHNRMAFAEIKDKEKQLLEKYEVDTFPLLMIIKSDNQKVLFDGTLSPETLSAFLSQHAPILQKPDGGAERKSKGKSGREPPPPPPKEDPVLYALNTQDDFQTDCLDKKGLCVIAFLPSEESDPEGRAQYIAVLESLVNGQNGNAFRFMWTDGVAQAQFKETFSPGPDLPRLIVLNSSKKRYSTFMVAFTADSITNFLEKLLSGKTATAPIDNIPSLKTDQ